MWRWPVPLQFLHSVRSHILWKVTLWPILTRRDSSNSWPTPLQIVTCSSVSMCISRTSSWFAALNHRLVTRSRNPLASFRGRNLMSDRLISSHCSSSRVAALRRCIIRNVTGVGFSEDANCWIPTRALAIESFSPIVLRFTSLLFLRWSLSELRSSAIFISSLSTSVWRSISCCCSESVLSRGSSDSRWRPRIFDCIIIRCTCSWVRSSDTFDDIPTAMIAVRKPMVIIPRFILVMWYILNVLRVGVIGKILPEVLRFGTRLIPVDGWRLGGLRVVDGWRLRGLRVVLMLCIMVVVVGIVGS